MDNHLLLSLNGRELSFLMSERILWTSVCRGVVELSWSALGKLRKTVPVFMSLSWLSSILLFWLLFYHHTLPVGYTPSSRSTPPQWRSHPHRSPLPSLLTSLRTRGNLESRPRYCRTRGALSWRCRLLRRHQERARERLCAAECRIWYITGPKTSTHIIQLWIIRG